MWIKATNGNVFEVPEDDEDLVKRVVSDGHEVFASDPREKGAKPWKSAPADSE